MCDEILVIRQGLVIINVGTLYNMLYIRTLKDQLEYQTKGAETPAESPRYNLSF